mgnify:CR=1 FL=1
MACGDVGGRVTDCAGSSVAVEWSDPEGGDGAPIPARRLRLHLRNWVAVATANGQACAEWATRGDERRKQHGGVWTCHFAGCVSNCPWGRCGRGGLDFLALAHSAARQLGGSAACRAVSSPAQWQRPRKWVCARAPHRATKPSWGSDAQAELRRIPAFLSVEVSLKKVIPEKPDLDRGCAGAIGRSSKNLFPSLVQVGEWSPAAVTAVFAECKSIYILQ